MKSRMLARSVALMLASGLASSAAATVVARDGFDVPPYAVAPLIGQAGGGTGFAGVWQAVPGVGTDMAVVGPGAIGRPFNNGASAGAYLDFSTPISLTSGQLFMSYTVRNLGSGNFNSTRLDINGGSSPVPGGFRGLLGGMELDAKFNFEVESGLGAAVAQTNIPTTGDHHIVGVMDYANGQIAMFVDPTSSSFYHSDGFNNADAVDGWVPAGPLSFGSYSLIENLSDSAVFGRVKFSTDARSVLGVPEPASWATMLFGISAIAAMLRTSRRRVSVLR